MFTGILHSADRAPPSIATALRRSPDDGYRGKARCSLQQATRVRYHSRSGRAEGHMEGFVFRKASAPDPIAGR